MYTLLIEEKEKTWREVKTIYTDNYHSLIQLANDEYSKRNYMIVKLIKQHIEN